MIKLPSSPDCIKEIEGIAKRICDKYELTKEVYPNLLISLTEAVNNAVIHGNKSDQNKFVQISTLKKEDFVSIKIKDEGAGFDPGNIPDPTSDENVDKLGGRGVFLINRLCDKVRFQDNGSAIEIMFKVC